MTGPRQGQERRRGWQRLSHGLYLPTDPVRPLADELRTWRLVLPPTAAFTHLTAAELAGWWLPAAPAHPVFAALRENDPDRDGAGCWCAGTRSRWP